MKEFIIDLVFVLLLICAVSIVFGDYQISETMLNRSIDNFEEKVSKQEDIEESYVVIADNSDNQVSSFMAVISDGCVSIIQFIVVVFSNLVSMIL